MIRDLLHLFFPHVCLSCQLPLLQPEYLVCTDCQFHLPDTKYHDWPENPVAKLFWGRVPLEQATASMFFRKDSRVQHLLHALKYKGQKELGEWMGHHFGLKVKALRSFQSVDVVIPVPLHPKKQQKRGYNQSWWIAKGVARALDLPVADSHLFRRWNTATQTRRSRFGRWTNVSSAFVLKNTRKLEGKHLLLVDDVVTTGATLEACAHELLEIKNTRISIAAMACA